MTFCHRQCLWSSSKVGNWPIEAILVHWNGTGKNGSYHSIAEKESTAESRQGETIDRRPDWCTGARLRMHIDEDGCLSGQGVGSSCTTVHSLSPLLTPREQRWSAEKKQATGESVRQLPTVLHAPCVVNREHRTKADLNRQFFLITSSSSSSSSSSFFDTSSRWHKIIISLPLNASRASPEALNNSRQNFLLNVVQAKLCLYN